MGHSRRPAAGPAELPTLYQPWIDAVVGGPIPAEREATCDCCAMAPDAADGEPAGGRSADVVYFDPRVKCCTFTPTLPNFLVGRILLDPDPAMAVGRAVVEKRMVEGVGVTPAGIEAAAPYDALYERTSSTGFGRSLSLLCPYFRSETETCGIWRHRQSVCTTWFCKHERGVVGQAFWTAMRQLLDTVEHALLAHCVRLLNPGPTAVRHAVAKAIGTERSTTPLDIDGADAPARRRGLWGAYAGRERAFYEAAAGIITPLTWDDVSRIGGATVALAATNLGEAYRTLTTSAIPARLTRQTVNVTFVSRHAVRVSTYSGYDPLTLPKPLADVLHVFDGRPTGRALAAIRQSGLTIERDALQRLVDFRVLTDADAESG